MMCELCERLKARWNERRGFAIRFMCGNCYALEEDEFLKRMARKERKENRKKGSTQSSISFFDERMDYEEEEKGSGIFNPEIC